METLHRIKEITDANLIYCLCPLILTLALIEALFRNRFKTKGALNIVCWIIISYTTITVILLSTGILFPEEQSFITEQPKKAESIIYWVILFSMTVLPFTLLIKKLAPKFLYVLAVAFFMKLGFYFERFIIIVPTVFRDHSTFAEVVYWISMFFLQGMILALLLIFILEASEKIKLRKQKIK